MIAFKNNHTQFKITPKEVTEHACMLIIFCRMNHGSKQAKRLKKQLIKLEDALAKGKFKS